MKKIYYLLVSFFFINSAHAQQGFTIESSEIKTYPKAGTINVSELKQDFHPRLQLIEMPQPGAKPYNDHLHTIKEQIKPTGKQLEKHGAAEPEPLQIINFEGNSFEGGIPNDNDMAISNGGMIVSVINSTLNVFDTTGTPLKAVSLHAFSDTLNLPESKYDPRALYDPQMDRFVVVCLNGRHDSTSFIVIGFSETNDPTGDWNLYSIPGDPLMDTSWSDYPIITLTDKELILTINALYNDSSWQNGFRQSFIWQIDKMAGYSGGSLATKVHSGIKYNGKSIRNICPVQGGSDLTGNKMYFLSNRNFDAESDTVFFYTLTGYMNEPNQIFTGIPLKSTTKYGVPPTARQPELHTFETNDARILDAFIENGKIQFVGNSVNSATGLSGIYHGFVTDIASKPKLSLNILGDENLDYGYPSIAYAGINPADDDALILVNHASDTVYAGNSAIFYKDGQYSDLIRLKSGSSRVNVMSGRIERWGDYSGAQRRYNAKGKVWFAASFGHRITGGFYEQVNGTWISEVANPYLFPSSINSPKQALSEVKAYPSPVAAFDPVTVTFSIDNQTYMSFNLYDAKGNLVKVLLNDRVKAGKNAFTFETNSLNPGIYFIEITDGKQTKVTERIMVK